MITKHKQLVLTERAVTQRINRALLRDQKMLRKSQSGIFFIVDLQRKCVAALDVDLQTLSKKLGVLRPWERIDA